MSFSLICKKACKFKIIAFFEKYTKNFHCFKSLKFCMKKILEHKNYFFFFGGTSCALTNTL